MADEKVERKVTVILPTDVLGFRWPLRRWPLDDYSGHGQQRARLLFDY